MSDARRPWFRPELLLGPGVVLAVVAGAGTLLGAPDVTLLAGVLALLLLAAGLVAVVVRRGR